MTVSAHPGVLLPVLPDSLDDKRGGCRSCPLLCHSEAHAAFCASDEYLRNPEVIKKRLYDPHKVIAVGVAEKPYTSVDVLFVGEAPDANASKQGKPFVGQTGHLLRTTIAEMFKGSKYTFGFAHVVRCQTPQNRTPNKTEINACTPELYREIEARSPRLIVAVGATALKVIGNVSGVVTLSGTVVKTDNPRIKETPLLACVHPSYILRAGNDQELQKFVDAIGTARKFLDGKMKKKGKEGVYRTLMTVEEVRDYVENVLLKADVISVDTESSTLSPFGKDRVKKGAEVGKYAPRILCYSFAASEDEGVTIPMDHKDSPFKTKSERQTVRALVKRVLTCTSVKKIFQHGKHDAKYIRGKDGYWVKGIHRDTLYTHQMIDETRGSHSLDRLAYTYTDIGGYEKVLEKYIKAHPDCDPRKGGSYANIPGDILFRYAAIDASVTLISNNRMVRKLKKTNKMALAVTRRLHPALLNTLARMEYRGATVDVPRVRQVKRMLRKKVRKATKALLKTDVVRRFVADKLKDNPRFEFKPNSSVQQRALLFERMGVVSYELTDNGEKIVRARLDRYTRTAVKRNEEPPTYEDVVKEAFHKKRQFGLFTVSADVLQDLKGKTGGVAEAFLAFRESNTALSTFIDPLESRLDDRNRVHGSFNPDGTATARLCVSGDTILDTFDGVMKISEVGRALEDGREVRVWTHRGRWRRVTKAYTKGQEEMVELSFHDGSSIVCTQGHLIRSGGQWVSASSFSGESGERTTYADGLDGLIRFVRSEPKPKQLVWDIEVEEDNSYLAQCIYHHNSSSSPNLQNLPSKDKGTVKSCYVSRFTRIERVRSRNRRNPVRYVRRRTRRGYILQADYSQIELRVAASFFDEPKMIQAYVDDADLHVLTALDIFELTQEEWDKLDPKDAKLKRTMTKRINFGILYQAGPDALVYTLKKDGVVITRQRAEELIRVYFEKRPDLKRNIEAFQEQVKKDGEYVAFTGYTRRVPDVFSVNRSLVSRALRQIVNFPIQHIAGWMTLLSLCIIEQRMRAAKMKSVLILTVHDSIVLDCVEEEVFTVAALVKDVMENITKYSLEILPDLDWSWLTVPIKAELEVGESWGYAVGIDPDDERDGELWSEKEEGGKVVTKYLRSPRTVKELRRMTRHATRVSMN